MSDSDEQNSLSKECAKPCRLSLHLIAKRHLSIDHKTWSHEKLLEELNKITHLRLDRENIAEIDGLELLGKAITNVYLQQNQISEIDNLDCLENLSFLTLSGNNITNIENLTRRKKLAFLDLSDNNIEHFDIDELPQSLMILDLRGNPCTNLPDYRGSIVQDLGKLRQLDGEQVTRNERREAGYVVSSSEEEEEEEGTDDEDYEHFADGESLQHTSSDMLLRSQRRVEATLEEHQRKAAMLNRMKLESRQGRK